MRNQEPGNEMKTSKNNLELYSETTNKIPSGGGPLGLLGGSPFKYWSIFLQGPYGSKHIPGEDAKAKK